jgi:hypothetical protein
VIVRSVAGCTASGASTRQPGALVHSIGGSSPRTSATIASRRNSCRASSRANPDPESIVHGAAVAQRAAGVDHEDLRGRVCSERACELPPLVSQDRASEAEVLHVLTQRIHRVEAADRDVHEAEVDREGALLEVRDGRSELLPDRARQARQHEHRAVRARRAAPVAHFPRPGSGLWHPARKRRRRAPAPHAGRALRLGGGSSLRDGRGVSLRRPLGRDVGDGPPGLRRVRLRSAPTRPRPRR